MSESIVSQSPDFVRHTAEDPVFEWLQTLEDGIVFDCHDLAEIFDADEIELLEGYMLESMVEEYPKEVSIERIALSGGACRIVQLRRVAPVRLGGEKRYPCHWRMWLRVLDFHKLQPVGSSYGYMDLAIAIGANPKVLNRIKILDLINGEFPDTTQVVNVVAPGNRKPTLMLRVVAV